MKLSKETVDVLKNFASINSGIEFKTGNKIATISSSKTVLAKATLKDDFPQDFCVYDLNQFLSVYFLNKDPEIDFDESNVIFKNGRSRTTYRKTAKHMIVTPPEKVLTLPVIVDYGTRWKNSEMINISQLLSLKIEMILLETP